MKTNFASNLSVGKSNLLSPKAKKGGFDLLLNQAKSNNFEKNSKVLAELKNQKEKFESSVLLNSYLTLQNIDAFTGGKKKNEENFFDILSPFYGLDAFKPKKLQLMDLLCLGVKQKVESLEKTAFSKLVFQKYDGLEFNKELKEEFEAKFGKEYKTDAKSLKEYDSFFKQKLKEGDSL